jgi:predicted metal-dependent hydrolase
LPLLLVPNRRAKRYVLRLRPDGVARVAIPRGGSTAEARRFAERSIPWLERQLLRRTSTPPADRRWLAGGEILLHGAPVRIEHAPNGEPGRVSVGIEMVRVKDPAGDLRPEIERYLWRKAARELGARTLELAAAHQFPVRRVTVRNQRSRWGSCSRRGTISLNWRLIQAPDYVRDYIILHELAHLREMNHSKRFWREVARLCPEFDAAERWLKQHAGLLR